MPWCSAKEDLEWWILHLNNWNGKSVLPVRVDIDKCFQVGVGCHLPRDQNRRFLERERAAHQLLITPGGGVRSEVICEREVQCHVFLRMDNQTVVAYVNKMGGTHSLPLMEQACQLCRWCLSRGITLSLEYLPGLENLVADKES